jgi:hypothetical protein
MAPVGFPSYGKSGHLAEKSWRRIVTRRLSDVRPHVEEKSRQLDGDGGRGLAVIGKMLGHTQQSTTSIYARLETDLFDRGGNGGGSMMLAGILSSEQQGRESNVKILYYRR